jgi:hypothetical protein
MNLVLGRFFLPCVLLLLSQVSLAQVEWSSFPEIAVGDEELEVPRVNVIVTGTVSSASSKEGIVGATVSVEVFKYFDYTDNHGKYVLELPPGRYKLTVRHVGMETRYINMNVYSAGVLDVKMKEGVVGLDEIVVSARPIDSNVKETIAGISKISVQEIKTLPTFMGELDIIKSIQTLPGVTSVGEGSSAFNVRGGRTDQNLILMDGAAIFNTSHALGFMSAFNQDVINNFTLYKGNVPSQLGGRASSVLEVNTRNGDFEKWKFQGGVGPVTGRMLAEGPLKKGKTSILIAGRASYADWFLKRIQATDIRNSSLFFYDANLSLTHRFSESKQLRVTGYTSRDHFTFSKQFAFNWENYLAGVELKTRTDQPLSPTFSASFGSYKSALIDPAGLDASQVQNRLDYFNIKEVIQYLANEKHQITTGGEVTTYIPRPEQLSGYNGNVITEKSVPRNKGMDAGLFVNDEWEISDRIGLSAGLRYSFYGQLGGSTVYEYESDVPKTPATITDTVSYSNGQFISKYAGLEPRLSMRFEVGEDMSIKGGYNRMRQYIHQISNSAAPTPVDLWQVSSAYLPPQVADNFSLGYFKNFRDNTWETSVEGFYKKMQNLVEYKDFPVLYLNPHIETELLSGDGRAWGAEFYIRRLKGFLTGWLSYTYSRTEVRVASDFTSTSINGGAWYPSSYNKPHSINLVLNKRGVHKKDAFSMIISYNSGRPFTALETSYMIGTTSVPVYSARNAYKIPNYFRVDASLTIGDVIKKFEDSLVFSVYNLFGRENAYSVFYRRSPSNFIPKPYKLSVLGAAMPSITYNFSF